MTYPELLITSANGTPWVVLYCPAGTGPNPFRAKPYAGKMEGWSRVEFFDARHSECARYDEPGQFVSSYYVNTIITRTGHGLNLQGDVPSWQIDADSMDLVAHFLATELYNDGMEIESETIVVAGFPI